VRALLEEDEHDLTEGRGVAKVSCGNREYVILFGAKCLGIRGLWAKK
jgi:hypothetical protein